MAEYLIQSETLDDIVDAINAKTGGSSSMTPAEMVTAIGSISGGGGMELLYETEPTTEQVSAIKVDFTQDMQGYDFYRVVLLGTFTKQPFPYAGFNTETNSKYLNAFAGTAVTNSHFECFVAKTENSYFSSISSGVAIITGGISYFHTRAYTSDAYFNTGFVVQIWGCNYANS